MKNSTRKWALMVSLACLPIFSATAAETQATAPETKTPASEAAPAKPAQSVSHTSKKHNKEVKKPAITFKNDEDKISYIIGHQIATSISNDDLKVNEKELVKALRDGLKGKASKIPQPEAQAFMQQYFTAQQKIRGEKNLKEGEAFLAKNKKAPKVVTLPSGLQYEVITVGTGKTPKATDSVTVNYEGTLISGKVFDSSYQRGQPVTFPVNGVIKGWTEALQLMPAGSKWKIFVPANLAYGARAPSPAIGPNQTLIFTVDLVKVNDPAPAKTPGAVSSSTTPASEPVKK